MRFLLSTVETYKFPTSGNTAQVEDNCLKKFTLIIFIKWKQSLKFTYVTIFDMGKAQIILGHPYQKLFNQECKIVVGVLMLSKDFALLDNLLMLLQVFDSIVISFGSGKNI